MKNKYNIKGEVVEIILENRKGEINIALVSSSKLDLLEKLDVKWHAVKWPGSKGYYVQASYKKDTGGPGTFILHRVLTGASDYARVVDHINHNTLDNRDENLRVVSRSQNNQNRSGPQPGNRTSKLRGITWNKKNSRWIVQGTYNKKKLYLGSFTDLEKAKEVFDEFKNRFYMKSTDVNDYEQTYTLEEIMDYIKSTRNGHRIGKSGKRYVSYHKLSGKWTAINYENSKIVHLGLFETPEEAEEAVNFRKQQLMTS